MGATAAEALRYAGGSTLNIPRGDTGTRTASLLLRTYVQRSYVLAKVYARWLQRLITVMAASMEATRTRRGQARKEDVARIRAARQRLSNLQYADRHREEMNATRARQRRDEARKAKVMRRPCLCCGTVTDVTIWQRLCPRCRESATSHQETYRHFA